jgi:hypothetical protein
METAPEEEDVPWVDDRHEFQKEPNPSPEEIACWCELIRETWSIRERRKRWRVAHSYSDIIGTPELELPPLTVPEVRPLPETYHDSETVPWENFTVDHDYWGTQ